MDQLQPFHSLLETIESNFLLKVVLEAAIADIVMMYAARFSKFMKWDSGQRTHAHVAMKAAWHAAHLATILGLGLFWVLLAIGFMLFSHTLLAFGVFAFLVAYFFMASALAIEDYAKLS